MRAGDLRTQVTFEQRTDVQDAAGQPIPTWTTLATDYVAVEPLQGREWFVASGQVFINPVRFRLRYRSDVTPRHRVNYGGVIYDIRAAVDVNGNERELHLYCDTGLTRG